MEPCGIPMIATPKNNIYVCCNGVKSNSKCPILNRIPPIKILIFICGYSYTVLPDSKTMELAIS
jgi:hypothetical protein